MAFFVGQKVVCVDASPSWCGLPCFLVERAVYTIAGFEAGRSNITRLLETGVYLAELRPTANGFVGAFRASRFRPVVETNIQQFRDLVAPIFHEKRVKEPAQ